VSSYTLGKKLKILVHGQECHPVLPFDQSAYEMVLSSYPRQRRLCLGFHRWVSQTKRKTPEPASSAQEITVTSPLFARLLTVLDSLCLILERSETEKGANARLKMATGHALHRSHSPGSPKQMKWLATVGVPLGGCSLPPV
jgi:hypothetical protein